MVKNSPKNKYFPTYRTCFILGIIILMFQVLLVSFFLNFNKDNIDSDQWEPSDSDSESNNEALNSARHSDDEETNLLAPNTKKHTTSSNISAQLRIEDLTFELPCQIIEKQALSALNRAKTQACKQLIANVSCMSFENRLYPIKLHSTCPSGDFKTGKELGCFKDEKAFRLLNGYFGENQINNSPSYCINLCLQSGFPYAGVQYSKECFCGSDEPPASSKLPDSSCNMKCPGDSHETCGGYFTMNIFQTGISKFSPQIANDNFSGNTSKIVFLLTLNGRALRQVRRLLKLIYHKEHYYYIHVDVRQDYLFRELLPLEKFPNIRLTRTRFATIWGGASLLRMLRSCMFELLQMTAWKWDFILNLSESDMPVKRIEKLTKFLSANPNRNFVKSHGREVQRFIQKQGLDKSFVECEYRMWRVGNRKLPLGIQVDGGSDWVALSRDFVQYVSDPRPDDLITGLLKVFNHTLLPAESFFHTVLRNSKFCNTYVDNNLHVTNWKRKLGCKCQYKHVVDWCGCSPNDFTSDDWAKVLNTQLRSLFFARKFEPIVNQAVILQLELWLHNLTKPSRNVENLQSYWQSIYHYNDLGVLLDEGLMTLSNSVSRRTLVLIKNSTSVCHFSLKSLVEVNSFHSNDKYRSTNFLFESAYLHVNGSNNLGKLEVALRPKNKLAKQKSPLMDRLISLSISTDYDQKEQLSRNFLKLLSPNSDPVLIYKFAKVSKQYNLTCLWIDPRGNLRDISTISLDDNNVQGHVKGTFKQPHWPGIWKLKLLYKNSLLAQMTFLIIPTRPFSEYSLDFNPVSNSPNYDKHLPNSVQKRVLELETQENVQKTGQELLMWIDDLTTSFYSIERLCVNVEFSIDICGNAIPTCKMTNWSSLASDPKSAINEINPQTGGFDIW
ncbi:hypothetical protein ABEB36_001046 [Hypothenemus hampei]|uniref:protein xylosyltransferase n=1 Tax=Hypothenemus hampei TaxID=57062 RepID=A0ABD1FDA9_HYPHA